MGWLSTVGDLLCIGGLRVNIQTGRQQAGNSPMLGWEMGPGQKRLLY